jgi:hypothetical protein
MSFVSTANIVAAVSGKIYPGQLFASTANIVTSIGNAAGQQTQNFQSNAGMVFALSGQKILVTRELKTTAFVKWKTLGELDRIYQFKSTAALVLATTADLNQYSSFTSTANIVTAAASDSKVINDFDVNPQIQWATNTPDGDTFRAFSCSPAINWSVLCDGPNLNRFYSFAPTIQFAINNPTWDAIGYGPRLDPSIQTDSTAKANQYMSFASTANIVTATSSDLSFTIPAALLKIIVDGSKVTETLTDFPVYVDITDSAGISDEDLSKFFISMNDDSKRKKIKLFQADKATECYVEIDNSDMANSKFGIHFKAPSLPAGVDTVFWLQYSPLWPDNTTYIGI